MFDNEIKKKNIQKIQVAYLILFASMRLTNTFMEGINEIPNNA